MNWLQNKIYGCYSYDREVLVNFQNVVQLSPVAVAVVKLQKEKENYCKDIDDSNLDFLQSDVCYQYLE